MTSSPGAARGFGFVREVQPVLNRHCASCHDGDAAKPDLRSRTQIADRPKDSDAPSAYRALIPYVHRVGVDGDPGLLTPGEYHADASPLIQLLRKGHEGVRLDVEAWDRIVTWIDLNAPYYGTWGGGRSKFQRRARSADGIAEGLRWTGRRSGGDPRVSPL